MKIVFAVHHPGAFRSFEGVVRCLCQMDHDVLVLHGRREKPIAMDRALKTCVRDLANCTEEEMLLRRSWTRLANIRELVNCANYLRARHPNPSHARRWINKVRQPLRMIAKARPGMKLMASSRILHMLQSVESITPPDREITRWLEISRPDVVVASPFISPVSRELEYIKAARFLHIPTVVAVLSWDNLTTKGTFHVIPDRVFVWNDALADEAIEFHDVPQNRISVTGAPVFDFWFDMQPSMPRSEFSARMGIDAQQPYFLYLGSSPFISRDETPFVRGLAKAMLTIPETRNIRLVVRPHPTNASRWKEIDAENVTLWPKEAEYVDMPEVRQDFFNSLVYSAGVIGVNTSAMIEAAIVDRPCMTIMTAHHARTQRGVGHFHHLLAGDFLEIARSYSEACAVIAAVSGGRDLKKHQRQRFVRDFIRPGGIDIPASTIMAKAIVSAGRGSDSNQGFRPITCLNYQ